MRPLHGGCVFAEAPDRPAGRARLFWSPTCDPQTICATAQPCDRDDRDAFDITRLSLPMSLLKDQAGEELAIRNGGRTVRLSIEQGSLLEGPVRLDFRLRGRRHLPYRLLALGQFDALLRLGRLPHALRGKERNITRPALILRTLNALATAGGAQSVATALFGPVEVAANWRHESDYFRMVTRRLIAKARHLVAGGYLDLLV